jgi:hypothetical protein
MSFELKPAIARSSVAVLCFWMTAFFIQGAARPVSAAPLAPVDIKQLYQSSEGPCAGELKGLAEPGAFDDQTVLCAALAEQAPSASSEKLESSEDDASIYATAYLSVDQLSVARRPNPQPWPGPRSVPEPGVAGLLALGALALRLGMRRRRAAAGL